MWIVFLCTVWTWFIALTGLLIWLQVDGWRHRAGHHAAAHRRPAQHVHLHQSPGGVCGAAGAGQAQHWHHQTLHRGSQLAGTVPRESSGAVFLFNYFLSYTAKLPRLIRFLCSLDAVACFRGWLQEIRFSKLQSAAVCNFNWLSWIIQSGFLIVSSPATLKWMKLRYWLK